MSAQLDYLSCQRWRQQTHSWRHPDDGGFDPRRHEVAPLDERAARAFVEAHHYSGSWPSPRLRFGLYRGSQLAGVSVLSVPVQQKVLTAPFPTLVPYYESLELGRFVLLDEVEANGESWFLARCFELARKEGVRGVVSFSDPVPRTDAEGNTVFPGHLGIIYRASNALYAGRATKRTLTLLPDGRPLNDRSAQKIRGREQGGDGVERRLRAFGASPRRPSEDDKGYLQRALAEIGARKLPHGGNLRYLFTLGSAREKRAIEIGLPIGPYPQGVAA